MIDDFKRVGVAILGFSNKLYIAIPIQNYHIKIYCTLGLKK